MVYASLTCFKKTMVFWQFFYPEREAVRTKYFTQLFYYYNCGKYGHIIRFCKVKKKVTKLEIDVVKEQFLQILENMFDEESKTKYEKS